MSQGDGRASFVARMGSALATAGFPPGPARVFAALLVDADGRMTAAELAAGLGLSAASVSGAVRHLEGLGMIRRERERGTRRDVFVVEDDAWHGTMNRAEQFYAPMLAALDRALGELDPEDPARRRLRLSREFLAFIVAEMSTLDARWQTRMRELGLDR
ncbi:GbsR/MarR family transcriptional regulator [Nocardioides sp. SYSU DS0651]|uniref:GbsR/MarR family transcriptional regulator n=1 Tax=Nocardioides sp. SYSU DS0651 TaxID=3415955 RepID=UPI003F4C215A